MQEDRDESSFSDFCSLGSLDSTSSYTWGLPQPEEPELPKKARFSCRQCQRKFENAYSLEQHAKVSRHRIFVCPIPGCDMSYTRRDSWTRHRRAHNLELRCDFCPESDQRKTFKRKDHLLTHMRNCHPQLYEVAEVSSARRTQPSYKNSHGPGITGDESGVAFRSKCNEPGIVRGAPDATEPTQRRLNTLEYESKALQDIKKIKRLHGDRNDVHRALEQRFDLSNSSTKEQFVQILADLVPQEGPPAFQAVPFGSPGDVTTT